MAAFVLEVSSPLPAADAWAAVWDLSAHDRVIPLTRLRGRVDAGERFVARTGIGPLAFDDPMDVVAWSPPGVHERGEAFIVKRGRVVRGSIRASVRPTDIPEGGAADVTVGGAARSLLRWEQDIRVLGVPGWADAVTGRIARAAYGRVLRQLLRPG